MPRGIQTDGGRPDRFLDRIARPLDGGLARARARGLREHEGVAGDDPDLHERQQQEEQDRQQQGELDGRGTAFVRAISRHFRQPDR